MKIAITTIIATTLLAGSTLTSVASAGNLTAEREARTARIEGLLQEVSADRLDRSERVLLKLQIAKLQAENRKIRRLADRARDKRAALQRRGLH